MSEISVTVVGSTTINPTVGNGDTVNVKIASTGERGPSGSVGSTGPANSLAIGTVTSGASASATITGTAPSQTLNLVLPAGATGATGSTGSVGATGSAGPAGPANSLSIGTVTSGAAAATITGTAPNQTLNLVLQKGDTGAQGPAGPPVNLADETPQPLGTASAGTALSAARADHVHAVGSVTYSSLSGIPSTFAPSPHQHAVGDVTGLQAALDGKQPAGTYATLVGGTVPSAQLPSFVDDIIEYANLAAFTEQSTGKIYVARDTGKIYRWSGSAYVEISPSPGSTDSVTEGSVNLYHTNARAAAAAPVQSIAGRTGTITLAQLASSGTASASTFLRGDGAWSAAGSTDASSLTSGTVAAARLPLATTTAAGAVIVGSGLAITAGGVLSWTNPEPPSAPQSIIFTRSSANPSGDNVSWTAGAGVAAATYEVQRAAFGSLPYVALGTTSSTTLSLVAFTRNDADGYRVRAVTASGVAGEWGYTAGAPNGGGGGSANIVEAATAAGFPGAGASSTLYIATDVSRIYRWAGVYVEIGTSGGGGTGTDADLRALFTPAAPTSVTATGGNAQATVSWTAPTVLSATPITDYTVQVSTNSGSTWTTFTRAASTATSATVTGLTNGTAVVFRVSATNGVGTGAYSTASSAVTPAAGAAITYANKFGTGSHSVTGTGTITATITGGGNGADTRLWLLIGTSGTLSYTVTASSEDEYDGGALYRTASSPASHSSSSYSNPPPGLTLTSSVVHGTQASSGTVAVTAGQYLVLRYAKDGGGDAYNDRITAVLSIA